MPRDSTPEEPTVFLFSPHDLSTVQGTTEAHYVARFFASHYPTHIFGPLSSGIPEAKVYKTRSGGLLSLLVMNLFLVPYMLFLASKHRPDVVYAYRNVIVPPMLIGWLTDATVVYDLRVDPYEQPKEFNPDSVFYRTFALLAREAHRFCLSRADHIFALSEPLREGLARNFGLNAQNIRLVPLGVDTEQFAPQESNRNTFHLCYVGSMSELRGLELVIEALNTLPASVQERLVFELYGTIQDEYREELELLAEDQYELDWKGYVPHEYIPKVVGKCDCAVSPLPPLDGFEVSSPAKVYEYMALGLPVIATDITPHQRILTDSENAILVHPTDPTPMGEALERLATDEEFHRELAINARRNALNHSWKSRFETIESNIDAL